MKTNLIIIALLSSILTHPIMAQYSCSSAISINDGYTTGTITTSGSSSTEDWVSSADASCGSASNSAFTSSDVYLFSYTTGATAGESFYFTIECNYTLDDEHAIGVWTGCSGASLSSCVTTTYKFADVLGVCAQSLAANTTYYIGVGKQYGSNLLKFKVIDFTVESSVTIPSNSCNLANVMDVAEPYAGSTRCNYSSWSGSPSVCGMSIENDSWMKFTASESDVVIDYSVSGCTREYGVQLSVFEGSCGSLSLLYGSCINYASNNSTGTWTFTGLTPGNTYYIRTDGYAGDLCSYSFSPISGVVVLPISLVEFEAIGLENGYNKLSWTTDSENNSDFIEVQKSIDGETFETVSHIDAAGNSNQSTHYHEIDRVNLSAATNYYRLKLVDLNGSYFYSETKAISNLPNAAISIFPNPSSTGVFEVRIDDVSAYETMNVYNMHGRQIHSSNINKTGSLKVDLSSFPAGIYILKISGTKQNIEHRVVIQG